MNCRHDYSRSTPLDVTAAFERDGYTRHPDARDEWTGRLDKASLFTCIVCGQHWLIASVSGVTGGDAVSVAEDVAVPVRVTAAEQLRDAASSSTALRLSMFDFF